MNIINDVSDEEWDIAEQHFATMEKSDYSTDDPRLIKLSAKENPALKHSFININGNIYVKATGEAIGEGKFGKVKLVQNRAGDNFAVKIEGRGKREDEEAEKKIMQYLGVFHGEAEKSYAENKLYKGRITRKKLYAVMNLQEGKDMDKLLYMDSTYTQRKTVDPVTKYLLAIKSAEALSGLHAKRVIHADIKSGNFMAKIDGATILVGAVDFGLSMLLPEGENVLIEKHDQTPKGSPMYIAPELYKITESQFSFASDIYALGVMFEYDLQLDIGHTFYEKILNKDPKERLSMPEVLDQLYAGLKKLPNLTPEITNMIEQYESKRKIEKKKEKIQKEALEEEHDNKVNQYYEQISTNKLSTLLKNYEFDVNAFDNTLFKSFCLADDIKSVKKLLASNRIELNAEILQFAMTNAEPDIQELLLADSRILNNTILDSAIEEGFSESVQVLLEKGVIPTYADIRYAVNNEMDDIVKLLTDKVVDDKQEIYNVALRRDDAKVVNFYLQNGVSPTYDDMISTLNRKSFNAFGALINYDLQLDVKDRQLINSQTLRQAVLDNNLEIVKICLENGKITPKNKDYQAAVAGNFSEIVDLFLQHGFTPTVKKEKVPETRSKSITHHKNEHQKSTEPIIRKTESTQILSSKDNIKKHRRTTK